MVCPKCKSEDVNVQVINEVELKTKHKGVLWWICIGWWWLPIKWICFTLPALIFKIFKKKKQKAVNKQKTVCVCQNCGHRWEN